MECIFVFSGPSKSGKTTLARRLAGELGYRFGSFGDYVRKEAARRKVADVSFRNLQEIGQGLVSSDVDGFCRAVLKEAGFSPGCGLVLDGIRHREALIAVRALAPGQKVRVVYVESPAEERARRGGLLQAEIGQMDSHPVESGVRELVREAQLTLNTSRPLEECFAELRRWAVRECASQPPVI